MTTIDPSMLILRIEGCSRCGEDHLGITYRKFTRPMNEFTHYAYCPSTGEPVMAKFYFPKPWYKRVLAWLLY